MTPAKLATIRGRAAAATPGPWGYHPSSGDILAADLTTVATCLHIPDGLWIAHARVDVAALLVEVGRLGREAAWLRAVLAGWDGEPR